MKTNNKLIGTGLLTAIAASLCCITPIIAVITGISGITSTVAWLEPVRPYFISLTILILALAWYQKLKSKKQIDCNCDTIENPKFIHSTTALGIITTFAIMMVTFPYYSGIFYAKADKQITVIDKSTIQKVEFTISGMTCSSCEEHINHEVNKLTGVISSNVSYENGKAKVNFDNTKTSTIEIEKAINSTGYAVTNKKEN